MATSLTTCLEQNSARTVFSVAIFNFQQTSAPFFTLYLQGCSVKQVSGMFHIKGKISEHVICYRFKSKPLTDSVHLGQKGASQPQVLCQWRIALKFHKLELGDGATPLLLPYPFPLESLFLFWCKYFKTKQEKKCVPLTLQNVPLEQSANPIRQNSTNAPLKKYQTLSFNQKYLQILDNIFRSQR